MLKIALPEGEDPSHEPEPLRALLAKAGHAADFKALAETLRERRLQPGEPSRPYWVRATSAAAVFSETRSPVCPG